MGIHANGIHSNGNGLASSPGSSPFLTDAQRAALDSALAAKHAAAAAERRATPGGHKAPTKGEVLHDRHLTRKNSTGKPRETKKGGGGGRFTWGSPLSPVDDDGSPLDSGDPNYDSDDDSGRAVVLETERSIAVKEYKRAVDSLLEEYLLSGDVGEAARSLRELDAPRYDHFFVKRAVTKALDRLDREREMTSALLSALYGEVISGEQVARGFRAVVEAIDDTVLDVPDAVELAALFTARAVVDDILPPAFVARLPAVEGTNAAALRARCESHLGARHAAERLLRCWGGGAGVDLSDSRAAVGAMLAEYVASRDGAEAERCLVRLALPFFHHEVVKQAVHMAMDKSEHEEVLCNLLQQLVAVGRISESQVCKGMERVAGWLEDSALDNPAARERFGAIVRRAQAGGWLPQGYEQPLAPADQGAQGASFSCGVAAFKLQALNVVKEYLESGDAGEVAEALAAMGEPGLHHIFVKQAVTLALERKDHDREAVSKLLRELVPQAVAPDAVARGFTRLLAAAEDLCLDTPDAPRLLALFLGRCVVDELLPPSFLGSCLDALRSGSEGVAVVKTAGAMLSARHAAERLQNCWHGGARTVEQLRQAMDQLLREYVASGDAREAARCLMELGVPHYHHELVVRALKKAFDADANGGDGGPLLALLAQLEGSGEVNQTQLRKGFARVEGGLDDIALDCPKAAALFDGYRSRAAAEGWLRAEGQALAV